ncbi:MAG: hypothetical protein AAFU60_03335, partial [Bacteroidota bacterium]
QYYFEYPRVGTSSAHERILEKVSTSVVDQLWEFQFGFRLRGHKASLDLFFTWHPSPIDTELFLGRRLGFRSGISFMIGRVNPFNPAY